MYLAQGIVARLRNPLTHEIVELDYGEAVEMLAIISRVARDVDAGTAAEPSNPRGSVRANTSDSAPSLGNTEADQMQ